MRLVLCPGELPDYGEVSRDCGGLKITSRLPENAYVSHLLLLSGLPEGYASADGLVKISQEMEMDKRQYESTPDNQSRAKARLKEKMRSLASVQTSFVDTKHRLLVALDRGETKLYRRETEDESAGFQFLYWVARTSSSWVRISWELGMTGMPKVFLLWSPYWDNYDDIIALLLSDRVPAELRGRAIWGYHFPRDQYSQREFFYALTPRQGYVPSRQGGQ